MTEPTTTPARRTTDAHPLPLVTAGQLAHEYAAAQRTQGHSPIVDVSLIPWLAFERLVNGEPQPNLNIQL